MEYLWQIPSGRKFPYTEALSRRKDMVPYDPSTKEGLIERAAKAKLPDNATVFFNALQSCQTRRQIIDLARAELGIEIKREAGKSSEAMRKEARQAFNKNLEAKELAWKKQVKDKMEAEKREAEEVERLRVFQQLKDMGKNPHPTTKLGKLQAMLADQQKE